jgi:hypothetical protein
MEKHVAYVCGLIHSSDSSYPVDPHGCRLAAGHSTPHEFVSTDGKVYLWESDEECTDCDPEDCECTVYWRAGYRE